MTRRTLPSQIISGLSAYFRVPGALFRYHLWPFQLLPAVISLILSILLFGGIYFVAGGFASWLDGLVEIPYEWLDKTVTVAIGVIAFTALVAAFFFAHKHLALIFLAPFLGAIAEETLKAVKGDSYIKNDLTISQSLARSAKINLQYIIREVFANLLFLLCGIIPAIGSVISASGMFLTQARFLGYGLMDFPLENRGLSVTESDRFARDRTGLSIGLGAGYLFLMMIPFIGWMFAPTFGTVAGTLKAIEELEEDPQGA
ncbi:MAG: EI24 domain-containing protein [Verrucomicrobiota bacterium]